MQFQLSQSEVASGRPTVRVFKPVKGFLLRGVATIPYCYLCGGGYNTTSGGVYVKFAGAQFFAGGGVGVAPSIKVTGSGGNYGYSTFSIPYPASGVAANNHLPMDLSDTMEDFEIDNATLRPAFCYNTKVNLVNTVSSKQEQLITEMPLHYLSEITAKYIGYDKRFAIWRVPKSEEITVASNRTLGTPLYLNLKYSLSNIIDNYQGTDGMVIPVFSDANCTSMATWGSWSGSAGFQGIVVKNVGEMFFIGEETATVMLGSYTPDPNLSLPYSCLELDNDKYLEISLLNLNSSFCGSFGADTASSPTSLDTTLSSNNIPAITYDLFGCEDSYVSVACSKYRTYFVVAGERQRQFSVGAGQMLYLPIDDYSVLEEIQLYPQTAGLGSPILLLEEARQYERLRNDISTISANSHSEDRLAISTYDDAGCYAQANLMSYFSNLSLQNVRQLLDDPLYQQQMYPCGSIIQGINYGFQKFATIPLANYANFDIRKTLNRVGVATAGVSPAPQGIDYSYEFVIQEPYSTVGIN